MQDPMDNSSVKDFDVPFEALSIALDVFHNEDLMVKVFAYAGLQFTIRCRRVCRTWDKAANTLMARWKTVCLSSVQPSSYSYPTLHPSEISLKNFLIPKCFDKSFVGILHRFPVLENLYFVGLSFNNELLQALSAVDYWSLKQLAFLKCKIDFGSIDLKMFFDTLPQLQLLELSNCEIFNPVVKVDFPTNSGTSLLLTQSVIKSTIRCGENWSKLVIQGPLDNVFQDCIIFFPTSTLTHLDLYKVTQTESIMNLLSEILPHLVHLGLSGNKYMAKSPENAATAISRLASLKSFSLLNNDNCYSLDLNEFLSNLVCKKGEALKSLEIGYYFLNGCTKGEILRKCTDLEEFTWQVYGPFSRSRSTFLDGMRGLKTLTLVDICPSESLSIRCALQDLPELNDVTIASSCPENKIAFAELAKDLAHINFKLVLLTKHRTSSHDNEVRAMAFRNFLVVEDCPSYYKYQGIAYRCLH